MDKQTYLEKIKEVRDKCRELNKQVAVLRADEMQWQNIRMLCAVHEAPHKVGDKVLVRHNEWDGKSQETICYVGAVGLNVETGDPDYRFNKLKKDGTMSKNQYSRYDLRNIVSIEKAS